MDQRNDWVLKLDHHVAEIEEAAVAHAEAAELALTEITSRFPLPTLLESPPKRPRLALSMTLEPVTSSGSTASW